MDKGSSKTFGENQAYFDILISNEVNQKYAIEIMEKATELYTGRNLEFSQCFEQVILDYLGEDVQPIEVTPGQRKSFFSLGQQA